MLLLHIIITNVSIIILLLLLLKPAAWFLYFWDTHICAWHLDLRMEGQCNRALSQYMGNDMVQNNCCGNLLPIHPTDALRIEQCSRSVCVRECLDGAQRLLMEYVHVLCTLISDYQRSFMNEFHWLITRSARVLFCIICTSLQHPTTYILYFIQDMLG